MDKHYMAAKALVNLMENKFHIGPWKIGLDPIIGLIPGIGDFVAALISFYVVWVGMQMKLPQEQIGKMISNIMVDLILGSVPVIGDIGDIFYKSNSKNLRIIDDYLKNNPIIEGEEVWRVS